MSSGASEHFLAGGGKFKTKAHFFGWIEKIVVKILKVNEIDGKGKLSDRNVVEVIISFFLIKNGKIEQRCK